MSRSEVTVHLSPRIALAPLLLVLAAACQDGGSQAVAAQPSSDATPPVVQSADPVCANVSKNLPFDRDGDGALDTVCADDFDGDGALETDDLQDAIDALDDADGRLVVALAGDYAPPANPDLRPRTNKVLIALPDHTELRCVAGVVLNGPSGTDPSQDYAVVGNASTSHGNVDVALVGCEIDGGAPDLYDGTDYSTRLRIGVYFRRTTGARVEDCHVHHTYHSGLYTSRSQGDVFRNNLVEDAGGFGNTNVLTRTAKPCIYAYASDGISVDDFVAEGNHLVRCAASGLNTRANTTNLEHEAVRNLVWRDNIIEHTGYAVGTAARPPTLYSKCMSLRGTEGAQILDNVCRSAGALTIWDAADGYRSDGDDNANSDVRIERLLVEDADASAGIWIGRHVDGLVLRDVEVDGTRADDGSPLDLPCLVLETPLRGALFERVALRHCGAEGLYELTTAGSGAVPGEELALRDLAIESTDLVDPTGGALRAGLRLRGPHRGLTIERLTARQATGPEVWFEGPLVDATLSDVTVDGVDPGWLGAFTEAVAPACSAAIDHQWITVRDAVAENDCDLAPGSTGTTAARCACRGGSWVPKPASADRPGIEFRDAGPSSGVTLLRVSVSNARHQPGVRVMGGVTDWTISGITGIDDSEATDLPQISALELPSRSSDVAVSKASCLGTGPGSDCVTYADEAAP